MRISDWSSDVCSSDLRIWRPEDRSGATDEGPGEGEPAASPCDIGPDAGQADIAGGCPGKLLSPARRRRCIDHIRTMMPVSERRVCRVLGQHRSTQRKAPRGADDEAALTEDNIALARQYGRYGYRRVTALRRNAGWHVNQKRVERIWRREGLKVPQRQPKRGRLWLNRSEEPKSELQ